MADNILYARVSNYTTSTSLVLPPVNYLLLENFSNPIEIDNDIDSTPSTKGVFLWGKDLGSRSILF